MTHDKKKDGTGQPDSAKDMPQDTPPAADDETTHPIPEQDQPAAAGEGGAGTDEEAPINLFEELKKAQEEARKNREGWQYAAAEFSNYRKRIERDREQLRQDAVGNAVKRYLPVVDDLERALKNVPESSVKDGWVEGIEMIYQKMLAALEADGVKAFGAAGETFDPNVHEAIGQAPCEDYSCGQIMEVLQKGYIIGEKVLRPAMVRVAA